MTLGNYEKGVKFERDASTVHITNWWSSRHNMAFTIDRKLWTELKECTDQFCNFDDYNWDWSLMNVINKCLGRTLTTLVAALPR